jgi:hypothetical protein
MQLTDLNSDSDTLDVELTDNTNSANTIDSNNNDFIDNASDINDIDTELTADTNDTIFDINDDIINADPTGSRPSSPTASDDIYHFIEQRLLSLDPVTTMALGSLNYDDHYHPHYFPPEKEGGFGKTLYKKSLPSTEVDADELGLVFFGEICSSLYGTAISAKGNHYAGTTENPKVCTTNCHSVLSDDFDLVSANYGQLHRQGHSGLASSNQSTTQQLG